MIIFVFIARITISRSQFRRDIIVHNLSPIDVINYITYNVVFTVDVVNG
jgi:hypothetical protein